MADEEAGRLELTLTLHGFDTFKYDVDGEVFARKLTLFLRGIRTSDKTVNGKRRHKFLLTALKKASASVSIREQVYSRGPKPSSGMEYFATAVDAVYNQRPEARLLPIPILKDIALLNSGAGNSFLFGEVKSNAGMLIRLDDYLGKVASRLITEIEVERSFQPKKFSGVAFAYFDGVLKLVDLLGESQRAVLTLTAGGRQIECMVDALTVEQLRDVLDRRVVVYGRAHYDGLSGLPVRLDVAKANPTKDRGEADLTRWRGAFDLPQPGGLEEWN